MHSELLEIFGFQIQSYGVCLAIGFVLCYLFARKLAQRTHRDVNEVETIVVLAAGAGLIGARIVYVWQNWDVEFANDPLAIFAIWKGGLVFYGGLLLAFPAFFLYAYSKKERFLSLADFCAVFVPLGHAFGRLGCFFHGCCYGGLCGDSPIGVSYPRGAPAFFQQVHEHVLSQYAAKSLPVWPTQLMEAIACLLFFGALWWIYQRFAKRHVGICVATYVIGYALIRFIGECFRDDPRGEQIFGLSFSQAVSVGLLIFGLILIVKMIGEKRYGKQNCEL